MFVDNHHLVRALQRLDPLLQFLTRATGLVGVPLATLKRALPSGVCADQTLQDVQDLVTIGILQLHSSATTLVWDSTETCVGFPSPTAAVEIQTKLTGSVGTLHASTKTAAKRRLAVLKRILKHQLKEGADVCLQAAPAVVGEVPTTEITPEKDSQEEVNEQKVDQLEDDENLLPTDDEQIARTNLNPLFGFDKTSNVESNNDKDALPTCILPKQVKYAGSSPRQEAIYKNLSSEALATIPLSLLTAFRLSSSCVNRRQLYQHQTKAIEAAVLHQTHTIVCTGTGSGKSLCYLLPVLTAAYKSNRTSILLYPTKALAQDQLCQLQQLLLKCGGDKNDLSERIRPATLDGDCPHSARAAIAETANVILTNPDAVHAAILPAGISLYQNLLARVAYVVVDEAHVYEGVFGAHVAMILSRLVRMSRVAAVRANSDAQQRLTFIATSATLPWPEELFRSLCPIAKVERTLVLRAEDDGSPRAAKHFLVWNPPILKTDGTSTGKVIMPKKLKSTESVVETTCGSTRKRQRDDETNVSKTPSSSTEQVIQLTTGSTGPKEPLMYRRHAADETALLFARAVANGVRVIAFCKTRNLVEWVFEKATAALKRNARTSHLVNSIESYRGGYNQTERRKIEERLFRGDLIGVVGTNALELGVDIGGIDLTLHCGYPSSYASLLQQAGRAGRDKGRLDVASCSVVVCFNSPPEQHLWKQPQALLGQGMSDPCIIPMNSGIVQAHLLCASEEFPLTGELAATALLNVEHVSIPSDHSLFGGEALYKDAIEQLISNGSIIKETFGVSLSDRTELSLYKARPSVRRPWTRVSIRSIEPVSYSIVNISHPVQAGRMDGVHDVQAIMDTIPYSRVFYHAHPGAIITHRGRKFKIISMTSPPAYVSQNFDYRRSLELAAYAKPTQVKYSTRPLSNSTVTVTKQLDRVELQSNEVHYCHARDAARGFTGSNSSSMRQAEKNNDCTRTRETDVKLAENVVAPYEGDLGECTSFAGCGMVTVKRTVTGYQKLSLITHSEISRAELSLPPMEFDSFGIWLDADATTLIPILGRQQFGMGVHALCHAILAVAPVFAPGIVRQDLECDHTFYCPTRIMIYDQRAGGSGSSERLWKLLFRDNNIIEAAIALLDGCSSCSQDSIYDSGCPSCLHASSCINNNTFLSRSAASIVGKHMYDRIKATSIYKRNLESATTKKPIDVVQALTPRREARKKALRKAREIEKARVRQFVVGRPSWPMD
jgi:DEAD/DEAH box helicase domain-containing protein